MYPPSQMRYRIFVILENSLLCNQSPPSSPPENHGSDFNHYDTVLPILELYINGIIC